MTIAATGFLLAVMARGAFALSDDADEQVFNGAGWVVIALFFASWIAISDAAHDTANDCGHHAHHHGRR